MLQYSIYRHLLSDNLSLAAFMKSEAVSVYDVKRRLAMLERADNKTIPDHYYKLGAEFSFRRVSSESRMDYIPIDNLADLIWFGLEKLSKRHLEMIDGRIYVKQKMQTKWQELITKIPPLLLQMAFLQKEKVFTGDLNTYITDNILPNVRYTALPYPYIPNMEQFMREKNGLNDLHIHLNGTTEFDIAWQDMLDNPFDIYMDFSAGYKNDMVKELFEDVSFINNPNDILHMLRIARGIRWKLVDVILGKNHTVDVNNGDKTDFWNYNDSVSGHPLKYHIPSENKLVLEAMFYVIVLSCLKRTQSERIAELFYFYLQILGLFNRLLVQQTSQFGFLQFQKYTLNQLRSHVEQQYLSRFLQLHGNDGRNVRLLEGRFSPKDSLDGNMELLSNIFAGWHALKQTLEYDRMDTESPELYLIAHFIKKKDCDDAFIPFRKLRGEIWQKARVLALMKEKNVMYADKIVAIDAAASELDTPPEVFAPVFRYLRRNGFRYITYHAGEDFYHIVSGMRAVYEAITFLCMNNGDRIGHATALGLDISQWKNSVKGKILMRCGDRLDDLLFIYHLISETHEESLSMVLPFVVEKINSLAVSIYGDYYSVSELVQAWKARLICPFHLEVLSSGHESAMYVVDEEELKSASVLSDRIKKLLLEYNSRECRRRRNDIIEVDVPDILNIDQMHVLQLLVLRIMHEKEIVIETLPTSNVRISSHLSMDTYQLWNWIKWEDEGHSIPPIVLGTDDPGIFCTNIYNEYANLYCNLTSRCKMTHVDAMKYVEKLYRNSVVYQFKKN